MDFLKKAADLVEKAQQQVKEQRRNDNDNRSQNQSQGQSHDQTGFSTYGAPQQQQPTQYQGQSVYQPPSAQPAVMTNSDSQKDGLRLPSQVLGAIENYVDTFRPGIAEGVAREIMEFERATIESLEQNIKSAIIGVFKGDSSGFQPNKNINEFRAIRESGQHYGTHMPQYNYPSPDVVASREGGESNLPAYGSRGLPFAGGSGQQVSLPQQYAEEPKKQQNSFVSALSKVKNFAKDAVDDFSDDVEREIKGMADKIGDLADDIEEKVTRIAPDLKAKISAVLHDLHVGLAEILTGAALGQLVKFLGGRISLEDIGTTAVAGIGGLLGGLLSRDKDKPAIQSQSRAIEEPGQGGGSGVSGLLSDKLSSGLTKVRNNSRVDFRSALGKIEEKMFDELPDGLKDILSKIFGGNPFDTDEQQRRIQPQHQGIFSEIGEKIREIIERIQKALRDRVLEIVSGGHRRLEDKAWGNVQDAIVGRVRQYAPDVQVQLKD